MASPYIYDNIGGSLGSEFPLRRPWWMSGQVWYVHSGSGADAVSPQGLSRQYPLATLAQAYTNASAGDAIVCLENHAETLTGSQALAKAGLGIFGEGSGANKPSFTCNGAIEMFTASAAGVIIDNLQFPASGTAPTSRITFSAAEFVLRSCDFDCGASDTAAAVKLATGAGTGLIEDTTFTSTATAKTALPISGINVANAVTGLGLRNVTFDGGTYGWSSFAFKGTAAVTRLYAIDLSLLNGSDFDLATGSVYKIHVKDRSGGSRIVLAA